ncbi:sensor histidine kinase KdpD [Anaeromyxobacter sp. PSR-1]|uniref:sensor histidine kinase n=1 Tax=Anaeromyxobacter sp. PSR-1 TaxID=1300915 RepID=UPI0005DAFD2D|nr:sensor histidine kinase KdpD [Anaeromyxobacter sp. PSR-1]GAO03800.1 sensor protein KdpD [Anaeromyxobacter sp. PSR-1]
MTPSTDRPDPDALLARVRAEEAREQGARFKVFFGFAPGVGKTYRMLQVARDLVAEGVDVAVGAVETHGRYDTAGLLLGLEVLPRRALPHHGRVLDEFDLDAALARRPRILLLDELAHTNAPGSRHAKRWQDVLELLGAGIEVYTTLNVQHVESLNDVVAQITHVQVRETVPDSVLDRADEIELVDVAPEELLERLREGKVYIPEQAALAREHFFKRGNLLALRELALRRMAERVDEDVLAFREAHGVQRAWATAERVLVCVGPAPDSARLVRAGRRIAAGLRAPWFAAAVEATGRPPLPEVDRDRLEAHLRLAESLGAEVVRLSGVHVPDGILEFARRKNVTRIVLGKPRHPRWRDRLRGSLVDEIIRGSGEIEVHVLSGPEDDAPVRAAPARPGGETPAREYLRAAAVMGVTTAVAAAARALLHVPDVEMLFLLGVMVVALTSGRRASILAAALAVACYDFFFVPPSFTLDVTDARYVLTFAMMLGVGIVIGTLTLRLREQQRAAVARERRTAAVYALGKELAAAMDATGVGTACVRAVAEAFECAALFLLARDRDTLEPVASAPPGQSLGTGELAVARWVHEHGRPAGRGTDTLPGEPVTCLPLRTFGDVLAVIALRPPRERGFTGEQRELVESLGRHAAVALDRVRLADEARRAALRVRTEELRSGLLSSVSHDLRTPLAAITGAGTLLLDEGVDDPIIRRELMTTMVEEAERLERLVSNLLDMTRLDAGVVEPKREWVPLVEVVGSAMNRLERPLAGRPIDVIIPDDVPLLSIDPILIQQLFVNLLENATKYTPPGTGIALRAGREGGTLVIEVADRGPGIPAGEEERIFERFQRAARPGVRGVGLGLPVARAIAQAHGGRLTAANRPGGGAVFRLTLPVLTPPPAPPEPGGEQPPVRGGVA